MSTAQSSEFPESFGPSDGAVPPPFRSLVDDAAIFPPGDAPLDEAVPAHQAHRASAYRDLVGSFVVSDVRIPDLLEILRAGSSAATPVGVTVVVSGGAGAIEPAVRWAQSAEELDLRGIEIALRDEEDLAHNARRVVAVVDHLLSAGQLTEETPVHVEPPRLYGATPGPSWLAALDEVAAADLRLKFRTGGVTPDAFPGAAELAACLDASLDRELALKCTAGLHHAVRHTAPADPRSSGGSEQLVDQHGFLNVLLATRAALDGAGAAALVEVLEERDPGVLLGRVTEADDQELATARDWFTSFGSCSVLEPLADLRALDLLPQLPPETVPAHDLEASNQR